MEPYRPLPHPSMLLTRLPPPRALLVSSEAIAGSSPACLPCLLFLPLHALWPRGPLIHWVHFPPVAVIESTWDEHVDTHGLFAPSMPPRFTDEQSEAESSWDSAHSTACVTISRMESFKSAPHGLMSPKFSPESSQLPPNWSPCLCPPSIEPFSLGTPGGELYSVCHAVTSLLKSFKSPHVG